MIERGVLEAGDIVWVDFNPALGTEQSGVRPALVLTDRDFNSLYPRSIVCPVTKNAIPWPTKVVLPDGLKTQGAVLCDQPRTFDRSKRGFRFIERAPAAVLAEVRAILAAILGFNR